MLHYCVKNVIQIIAIYAICISFVKVEKSDENKTNNVVRRGAISSG